MWHAFNATCIIVSCILCDVYCMWCTLNVTCIQYDVNLMWRTLNVTYIQSDVHSIWRTFDVMYIQYDIHFNVTCIQCDVHSMWRTLNLTYIQVNVHSMWRTSNVTCLPMWHTHSIWRVFYSRVPGDRNHYFWPSQRVSKHTLMKSETQPASVVSINH